MVCQDGATSMSIKVMTYIWDNSKASGSELLLLLAIADHSADDGYCWPTIETLAKKIRMSRWSVMRSVSSLVEKGELYVVKSNKNNRYVVVMGRESEEIEQVLKQRKETSIGNNLSRSKLQRSTDATQIRSKGATQIRSTDATLIINESSTEPSNNIDNDNEKTDGRAWFMALSNLCVVNLKVATKAQRSQISQSANILKKAGVMPEQIDAFGNWWYDEDWRGKKGQPPTPAQVRSEWGKFMKSGVAKGTQRIVKMGR